VSHELPPSHCSPSRGFTILSPQKEIVQLYVQFAVPVPATPSSHSSGDSTIELPQTGIISDVELSVVEVVEVIEVVELSIVVVELPKLVLECP
jgi:hypothetical protein